MSRSSTSRKGPVVVPGNVVDWRTTSCPARSAGRIVSAADRTGRRSGSLESVIGVGTQTKTASASPSGASADRWTSRPAARAAASRSSVMSSIGDVAPRSSVTRFGLASAPMTRQPDSTNAIASGSPT